MTEKTENQMPEKPELRLGFIPLTDCCVMIAAKELGYFEKYGLNVTLSKEASWANIRDKVCVGALDGAHMLAGMPIATTLGLGFSKKHLVTAFSMDLNGNAITVSNNLYERLLDIDDSIQTSSVRTTHALKQLIDSDKAAGKAPLTFAMVYPFSNHNYEIRYWMASAGINPDQDVRLMVIPPQYMVENLRTGHIDGYCVGEPWNAQAVSESVGKTLITGYEIWNNSPEKVFGVTQAWANKYPKTHIALLKALIETARWIDKPENRSTVANMISRPEYIGVTADVIKMSMTGTYQYKTSANPVPLPDFNVFYRYLANFPWRSHAIWIISQMVRWGQLEEPVHFKQIAEKVYRPDIYRQAAEELGLSSPAMEYKSEGTHSAAWQLKDNAHTFDMGADKFLDGMVYDPEQVIDYIRSFPIKNLKIDIEQLTKTNSG
jgi:nitrate/nitrite transport system substrate-binding protein